MSAVPEQILSAETQEQLQSAAFEYWQQGGRDSAVDDHLKARLGEEGYDDLWADYRAFDDEMEANLNQGPTRG